MSDTIHINVSYEVLLSARESLALTRNQATEKTEIPAKRLVQLETGEKQPTLEELKAFSKAYKRTIATLLLTPTHRRKNRCRQTDERLIPINLEISMKKPLWPFARQDLYWIGI